MEVLENTLETRLDEFLGRPLFCFLAQTSEGGPRVSPLWFLWEDRTVWIIATPGDRSYPERVRRDPRSAVAVVDFDRTTGRVEHVGMRGEARLEPYDSERAGRLLETYLGGDRTEWPDRFVDLPPEDHRLVAVEPETVVARDQSYDAPPGADG